MAFQTGESKISRKSVSGISREMQEQRALKPGSRKEAQGLMIFSDESLFYLSKQ
jgi:hypothetical protein